jgi:hypothetical protein
MMLASGSVRFTSLVNHGRPTNSGTSSASRADLPRDALADLCDHRDSSILDRGEIGLYEALGWRLAAALDRVSWRVGRAFTDLPFLALRGFGVLRRWNCPSRGKEMGCAA